jgi:hypothetical protein
MKKILLALSMISICSVSNATVTCSMTTPSSENVTGIMYYYIMSSDCTITNKTTSRQDYTISDKGEILDNQGTTYTLGYNVKEYKLSLNPGESQRKTYEVFFPLGFPHMGYFPAAQTVTVTGGGENFKQRSDGIISVAR